MRGRCWRFSGARYDLWFKGAALHGDQTCRAEGDRLIRTALPPSRPLALLSEYMTDTVIPQSQRQRFSIHCRKVLRH